MALSRTNDFLDRFSWDGSILRLLVESEMAPFVDAGARRVEMIGPMVRPRKPMNQGSRNR